MSKNIYVIDDEVNILEILTYNLEKEGYTVKSFQNGKNFLSQFEEEKPDLVILDLMLPDIDGFDICKTIKSNTDVPIIILSAKGEELDKVLGLELGADDYIVKPFGIRELIARVKNILKRVNGEISPLSDKPLKNTYNFGEIKLFIDELKHEVFLDSMKVKLNPKEFSILVLLVKNLNNLIKRIELIKRIWGEDYYGDTRTLDVHIRRIRDKMSYMDFGNKFIKTVHGYGYKLTNNTEEDK